MEEEETDDNEIKLQQDSAKLIDELTTSVPLFLYKTVEPSGSVRIRRIVKRSNTDKLISMFNAFQEWPQLLDPALRSLVEPLVFTFQTYVSQYSEAYQVSPHNEEDSIEPIPRAICKLLYTLCKVRGSKVIINFLSNEPSMLEPMLDAFERWASVRDEAQDEAHMIWEERYIMLLWLSHLTRTPFDLASISSPVPGTRSCSSVPFDPPISLPDVALRLLALGFRYLDSTTKEGEGAQLLLVRLCTRPDMVRSDLHKTCVSWTLKSLRRFGGSNKQVSVYAYIGFLAFLARFFASCEKCLAVPFLYMGLDYLQGIIACNSDQERMIYGSAAVRKLSIKIHRAFATHLLSEGVLLPESSVDETDLLSTIVDHLVTSLRDRDNAVRFAASKALSMIAQKVDQDMAEQLVDDIVERLQENVILKNIDSSDGALLSSPPSSVSFDQDLSAVDPAQWQGLIFTLSHLLFRHALPKSRLTSVIGHVMNCLDFEQRSPMGASVGAGVRDAACFGIWSLARKYSTSELLQVLPNIRASRHHGHASVLEMLAAELVLTATLDPEGNIRRAASAALQELVGRHPDTVPDGISLVQIVDYQAVGLRSRAMNAVAIQAAYLNDLYMYAVSDGLFSWRALRSPEANIRRQAALTIGEVFRLHGPKSMMPLQRQLNSRATYPIDQWHGLYLAFAAAIKENPAILSYGSSVITLVGSSEEQIFLLRENGPFSKRDIVATGKNASLAAEALCAMICALARTLQGGMNPKMLEYHVQLVKLSLKHFYKTPLEVYRTAPVVLFNQLNHEGRQDFLHDCILETERSQRVPAKAVPWIAALGSILSDGAIRSTAAFQASATQIREILLSLLCKESDWQVKSAALKYLYRPVYLGCADNLDAEPLHQALIACLSDHSILNARDVGSEVRIQAIDTVVSLHSQPLWDQQQISGKIYGLAVERLDRVRDCAWRCIVEFSDIAVSGMGLTLIAKPEQLVSISTASTIYFELVLRICNCASLRLSMLEGLITSASSGSEALIRASRTAMINCFNAFSPEEVDLFYKALLQIIQANVPDGRLIRPGLEVLAFLLDIDTPPRLVKAQPEREALLKSMTLLRKSPDLRLLEAMTNIYAGLSRYDDLRGRALAAVRQLLIHRFPKVRLMAAASLYVIEPDDRLKLLDLSVSGPSLRKQVQTIYGLDSRTPKQKSLAIPTIKAQSTEDG
ncbi:MAG: hypothetical protein Q9219_005571 [cf. Caloplaca sp. 3 TL-2023]